MTALDDVVASLLAERYAGAWWHKPEPAKPDMDQLTGRRRAQAAADDVATYIGRHETELAAYYKQLDAATDALTELGGQLQQDLMDQGIEPNLPPWAESNCKEFFDSSIPGLPNGWTEWEEWRVRIADTWASPLIHARVAEALKDDPAFSLRKRTVWVSEWEDA